MSLNDAKFVAAIPTDDQLAQISGLTRADLQAHIEQLLADPQRFQKRSFEVGQPETSGNCHKVPFGLSFFDVLAIKGHIEICTSACWKAEVSACLEIFGNQVACRTVTIDCHGAETTLINFGIEGLAWLNVSVGARGENICVYLKGYAQFLHWREDFDETLFCVHTLPMIEA